VSVFKIDERPLSEAPMVLSFRRDAISGTVQLKCSFLS